jgi:hypothetical protein
MNRRSLLKYLGLAPLAAVVPVVATPTAAEYPCWVAKPDSVVEFTRWAVARLEARARTRRCCLP